MKKTTIISIALIMSMCIIGLFAAGEVNYFAAKNINEHDDAPVIVIDKIGVNEKINDVSLNDGVFFENESYAPTNGETVLFGHRTMQGSPFLRLNELSAGDIITVEWPGVGEVTYTVTGSKIVPADYALEPSGDANKIDLITCHPLGFCSERLIVEANMTSVTPIDSDVVNANPIENNAMIITVAFLIVGLIVAYFAPMESRKLVAATVIAITIALVYFNFNPMPSEIIYSII